MQNISDNAIDKDYLYLALGMILSNLLTLDYLMRKVIDKKGGDGFALNFFGSVRTKYNSYFNEENKVSQKILELRNAIAHGMVSFPEPKEKSVGTLMKYKKATKVISFKEDLTKQWLKQKADETYEAAMKVAKQLHANDQDG